MRQLEHRAILLGVALVLSGCGGDAPAPEIPADGANAQAPGTAESPRSPASLAEIAPGDTGAILGLMREVMTAGDNGLAAAERRDTTLAPEPDREPRRLTLYVRQGQLLKLVATEPNDAGAMTGETNAWFVEGEVRVVQEPFATLFLDGDRIALWTDEVLEPVAVPETDRMQRERAIVDTLRARLAVFGVRYP